MMDKDYLLEADFDELSLQECGIEKCKHDKIVDFTVKPYHLFHYIFAGKGTLIMNDVKYELKKGDIFYIPPEKHAVYYPNPEDPWSYVWVGFEGNRSLKYLKRLELSYQTPIFKDTKDFDLRQLFLNISDKYQHSKYFTIEMLSIFMQILYRMIVSKNAKEIILSANETHIKMVKQYIENNYQFNIKITDIAKALSLSPNYLANIFKKELKMSPKTLLTQYRMNQAVKYLISTNAPIVEISKKVGYDNPLHFSSEFKKIYNKSPKNYRTSFM